MSKTRLRPALGGAAILVMAGFVCGFGPHLRAQAAAPTDKSSPQDAYPQETLANSAGGETSLPTARGETATVLVSIAVDCPISTDYIPTLNEIAKKYRPRGVNLIAINPSAGQSLKDMADHARGHKLTLPYLLDAGGEIARRLDFKVTPEVCVFDATGKAVYRGRIDDRYRPRSSGGPPFALDLEAALDQLLAGKEVTQPRTKAMGCPIQWTVPATK